MWTDPLVLAAGDLLARQRTAIEQRVPQSLAGHRRRMASATSECLHVLDALLTANPDMRQTIEAAVAAADHDPSFAFMRILPEAPVLSLARARAVEESAFGSRSEEVAELSLLFSLFTVVMDGLVDEAPASLAKIGPWLAVMVRDQPWAETNPVPPAPRDLDDDSVARIAVWVTTEITDRIRSSSAWQADPLLREQFRTAARQAFDAEIASVDIHIAQVPPENLNATRERLLDKSRHWSAVTALAPFCLLGWPPSLDAEGYMTFSRAVGDYAGWLDDLLDIVPDIRAGIWNDVMIEIYQVGSQLYPHLRSNPASCIASGLVNPMVIDHVVRRGSTLFDETLDHLADLSLNQTTIIDTLADVTMAVLETSQVTAGV